MKTTENKKEDFLTKKEWSKPIVKKISQEETEYGGAINTDGSYPSTHS